MLERVVCRLTLISRHRKTPALPVLHAKGTGVTNPLWGRKGLFHASTEEEHRHTEAEETVY